MLIRRFEKQDFAFYKLWFSDQELNTRLGPLDQGWLDHVLNETEGCQLVAWENGFPVGCCGVIFPTAAENYFFVTDISVNPAQKRKGIAGRLIRRIQEELDPSGKSHWKAVVDQDNEAAVGLLLSLGWMREPERDSNEMLGFTTTV